MPPTLLAPITGLDEETRGAERRNLADGWWVIGVAWVLALGLIWLTAANFHAVSLAADRVEALNRLAPANQTGRGACAQLARTQPPTMFDPDGECWINRAQQQFREGTVRPHDYPFDNAPYGREQHWSSSLSWWLLLLGVLTHAWTGWPMDMAIAQAAAWANPVLFAVVLTTLALVLRRQTDAWTAGAFIVTLAAMSGVEWDFSYGRPDHHGLHLMAFIGLLLGALLAGMGWVRAGSRGGRDTEGELDGALVRGTLPWRRARFWFTLSGIAGGTGLWIGSTQQCFCIGVLGAGAVLGAWCFARQTAAGTTRFAPELWRHWARVGATTSLAFYLLEYFPWHLEMRTEVNSPLMALAWLGGGELMWIMMTARLDWAETPWRDRWPWLGRVALGLLGLSALPLAILLGPRSWFVLGNPLLRRSASLISEGQPWFDPRHPVAALNVVWTSTGCLLVALPSAVGVLIWGRQVPWRRSGILTLALSSAVFLAWTLAQTRWIGFLEVSLALLTLLIAPALPLGSRRWPVALLALCVPGWLAFGRLQWRTRSESPARHASALVEGMMSLREAAWNLELYARGGNRPARVMAPPGESPTLHYYGGVDTVGSDYWENISGNAATVDFYTDSGDTAARRIARERGLDFVVAVAQPSFVLEMQMLQTGRTDVAAARRTLAFRLSNPMGVGVPDWLEPLPLLDAPMAKADGIRLYRVRRDRL